MVLEWAWGGTQMAFHHSGAPLEMAPRSKESVDVDWHALCRQVIQPCNLNPLLFNGHLQTFGVVFDKPPRTIYYKRWVFQQENEMFGGQYAVDFVEKRSLEGEKAESDPYKNDHSVAPFTTNLTETEFQELDSLDVKPMLVILHGVSGGSHESYLRHALVPFVCDEDQKWEACIVNSRGCAYSELSSGLLYNARSTWDFRQTVYWLRERFPNRPLFGVGFSMGANILIHYLAEESVNCPLTAAVSCSNPWNLEVLSHHLQGSYVMREIYSRGLTRGLKKYLMRNMKQITTVPNVSPDEIQRMQYLFEFDRAIQKPMWGYPTETAYYREASSVDPLLSVRIPLLALNAEDDPLSPYHGIPFEEAKHNPFVVLVTTSKGGHLGWFQKDGSRWFVQTTYNVLQTFWKTVASRETGAVNQRINKKTLQHSPRAFCHSCGRFCRLSFDKS